MVKLSKRQGLRKTLESSKRWRLRMAFLLREVKVEKDIMVQVEVDGQERVWNHGIIGV